MAVASIALFVSLGRHQRGRGQLRAQRGQGRRQGRRQVAATKSKAAGKLIATNTSGPDKGKIQASTWPGVARTQTFGRAFEVADNAPGAPVLIGDGGSLGQLTATCNDQAPARASRTRPPT